MCLHFVKYIGACLDSKSRDGDTENILSSSTEVMTFVSLNKIDGINRFGDINEDYSNLIEDMLKDKNIQNMENEIAARQVTEVKVAAPAQAYFARGLPLHKFGTKSSQVHTFSLCQDCVISKILKHFFCFILSGWRRC